MDDKVDMIVTSIKEKLVTGCNSSKFREFSELFKAALLKALHGVRLSWETIKDILCKLRNRLSEKFSQQVNSGQWNVKHKEIARGSHGTIILEGSYGARPARRAAVKRLVRTDANVGSKEYKAYVEADKLKNIVRCYGKESDREYVYLFMELCICSLNDLIQIYSPISQPDIRSASERKRLKLVRNHLGDHITLWKENGYPSPLLLKLMRDVVRGLAHLHENRIAHRNLNPRNILIAEETALCAKISDMAASKKFKDREQLQFESQSAEDLLRLGCVVSFCINGGGHTFGDPPECHTNDVYDTLPEAVDLISQLLNSSADQRPKAIQVYHHPLFWDSDIKLSFLRETSDMVEGNRKSKLSKALIKIVQPQVMERPWNTEVDSELINFIESPSVRRHKRYNYNHFLDLLRLVRNNWNHYQELPREIQEIFGPIPEGYYNYFAKRFPNLLIQVYKVSCKEEEHFQKYFNGNPFE